MKAEQIDVYGVDNISSRPLKIFRELIKKRECSLVSGLSLSDFLVSVIGKL